jgi:hypothetical protein
MKTIFTGALLSLSIALYAQTASVLSGNMLTGTNNSYIFNFNSTDINNCVGIGNMFDNGNSGNLYNFTDSTLYLHPFDSLQANSDTIFAGFYIDNCVSAVLPGPGVSDSLRIIISYQCHCPDGGGFDIGVYNTSNEVSGALGIASGPTQQHTFVIDTFYLSQSNLNQLTGYSDIEGVYFITYPYTIGGGTMFEIDKLLIGEGEFPTSISHQSKRPLNVYPNPSNGSFRIDSDAPVDMVLIRDINGKLISSYNSDNIDLIHTDLNSGLYLVECHSGQKIIHTKIVIRK